MDYYKHPTPSPPAPTITIVRVYEVQMKGGVFNECLLMNIFPTGCPHGQGGRGVSQMQTAADGDQKSLKICGHPLWIAPYL